MVNKLPPSTSIEWIMLPVFGLVAGGMSGAYAYQIFRPKDHVITISHERIHIVDSIYGKWSDYELSADQISEFVIHEDNAMFIMKTRKAHALGSTLSMRSHDIREALREFHPGIKTPRY